jgi:hypothetical protein
MITNSDSKAQAERYSQWAARIQRWGLTGLMGAFLEAAGPLAPIAGQALYVAQPTLGLFMSRQSITDLAQWLDQPEGLADLRRALEIVPEVPLPSESPAPVDPTGGDSSI